jgi:hypothetical protein
MKIRVEAIRTVEGTGLLHVDVAFLDQDQVVHRNDFIMQIAPAYRVYTGALGPDGEILDPKAFEERQTDVVAEVLANIRAYVARTDFGKSRFDRRDPAIRTEDTDPLGLRARPGVAALVGVERDV